MSPKNTSTATTPKESAPATKPVSQLVVGAERQEKISLYVRAANWLKNRETALSRFQAINPKIKAVRHPRQKSADFCFIDFASIADRDLVFAELKTNSELTVKQVSKDVPQLLERRIRKINEHREKKKQARELKRHIEKLKKNEKKQQPQVSTEVMVWNVPAGTTKADLKVHFPDCIDVRLNRKGKSPAQRRAWKKQSTATVVFATPREAFAAAQQTVEVQESKLKVTLNVGKKKTKKNKKKAAEKGTKLAAGEEQQADKVTADEEQDGDKTVDDDEAVDVDDEEQDSDAEDEDSEMDEDSGEEDGEEEEDDEEIEDAEEVEDEVEDEEEEDDDSMSD